MFSKLIKLKDKEKRSLVKKIISKKLWKINYVFINFINKFIKNNSGDVKLKNGKLLRLNINSYVEYYRYKSFFTKEPETLKWLEEFCIDDNIMYDIGANIGIYSLYYSILAENKEKVFCFEPESNNYQSLNHNIYLNKLDNILAFNSGISEKNSYDSLYVGNFNAGNSGHNIGSKSSQLNSEVTIKQGIFTYTLDSLWQKYNLPFPNVIKIDVDGFEPNIIEGAKETLKDTRLKSILIEIDKENEFLKDIIEENGFEDTTHKYTESIRDNKIYTRRK